MRADQSQFDAIEQILCAMVDDVLRHGFAAQLVEGFDAALSVESYEHTTQVEHDILDPLLHNCVQRYE